MILASPVSTNQITLRKYLSFQTFIKVVYIPTSFLFKIFLSPMATLFQLDVCPYKK